LTCWEEKIRSCELKDLQFR